MPSDFTKGPGPNQTNKKQGQHRPKTISKCPDPKQNTGVNHFQNPDPLQKPRNKTWIQSLETQFCKAVPEDQHRIHIWDPCLAPPCGSFCGPLFGALWVLFWLWPPLEANLCQLYSTLRNNAFGPKSGFRTGFRPDSNRESFKIGPPAGLRPAGGPILRFSRQESGRNSIRKPDLPPGSAIV